MGPAAMTAMIVRRIEGRLVIELPEALISEAQLREGDVLEATGVRSGAFSVEAASDVRARQIRHGLDAMARFDRTYKVLAT